MINKFIIILILGFITVLNAKVNAIVSILPEVTFVKAIGGDKVNISLMVKPGNEPHTYEPKPSQMKDISKANIYFAIGVEFENVWLKKFKNQNHNMNIIDLSKNITKIKISEHHEENNHNKEHSHNGLDPHIWTSPYNVKIIAKGIYTTLIKFDPKNKTYYKNNYIKFLNHINQTDEKIKMILSDVKNGTKFMVFHPAWGYFARDYHLIQSAIEVDGKKPKPRQIIYIINEAKNQNIKAIFTAPEFNQKVAKQIANQVGVPVVKVTPLNSKWSENLINLATKIAN